VAEDRSDRSQLGSVGNVVIMCQVCAKKFIVIVDDSKLVKGLGITG